MTRYKWIDELRGIAILAVLIDHTFGLLPQFDISIIRLHTFYSVDWFIILSGISNYLSANRSRFIFPRSVFVFWLKRVKSLLLPYSVASILYYLINYPQHSLQAALFLTVNFRTSSLFYFVMVLAELYVIFPFIYLFYLKYAKWFTLIPIVIGLCYFCYFLYPMVMPPWDYLLVGYPTFLPFLFPFLMGMILARKLGKLNWIVYLFCLLLFLVLERSALAPAASFLGTIPNIYQAVWSLLLLILIYGILKFSFLSRLKAVLAYLGVHSMFIYLFHFLFISKISYFYRNENGSVYFFLIIVMSILFSLGVEYIYKSGNKLLGRSFNSLLKTKRQ